MAENVKGLLFWDTHTKPDKAKIIGKQFVEKQAEIR
jgi:hypothetical protein